MLLCPLAPGEEESYSILFLLCVFKGRDSGARKHLSDLLKHLKIISNYINDV